MALIRDIRLFEADRPNESGNSLPEYMGRIYDYDSMDAQDAIDRLLFALRHRGFELKGFDHLYLNFSTVLPHGSMQMANRAVFREDNWLRWVDVGCDLLAFNSWEFPEKRAFVLSKIADALMFTAKEDQCAMASECIREVLTLGDQLWIPYKHKENEKYCVDVLVRITDDLDFIPLVRISTKEGREVHSQELPPYVRDALICQFSSFSIGKFSLRISPRKNYISEFHDLEPIKINW